MTGCTVSLLKQNKREHRTTPNFSNSQKNQYVRLVKSYSTFILECRSHPHWIQQLDKTINANTFCDMVQQFTREWGCICKVWSFQHDIAPHTPYTGHMSWCNNFSGNVWTIYCIVPNLPHWIIICLGHWSQTCKVTNSIIMRKQKWMFFNDHKCNSMITITLDHTETTASMFSGISLKHNDNSDFSGANSRS